MSTPESQNPSSFPKNLLLLLILICGATCYFSYKSMTEVRQLAAELIFEESEDYAEVAPDPVDNPKPALRKGINVKATYQIEDRYVAYGGIGTPESVGNQEGTIVIKVSVDKYGEVKKTSVDPSSTITDPEVVEAARRAALKTNFNINTDAPNLQSGTITFTFKK